MDVQKTLLHWLLVPRLRLKASGLLGTALLSSVLVTTLTTAVAQATTSDMTMIEVQVSGPTRDAAYGKAIEQGIQALVAQVLPTSTPSFGQVVQGFPRGSVRLGKVVAERAAGNTVSMTVQVSVPRGAVVQAVLRTQPQLAQTRIAVVIPEVILRRPVPDPAAETEINRALIGSGFRVVDASQQVLNATRELVRGSASLDAQAVAELRTRLNADILVTGEAFAEEYGAVVGGLRGYTARLEVKVIDLNSGQLLHSQAFQGSAANATDALAGKTALMNVGKAAGAVLPNIILSALHGSSAVAPRQYTLKVAPPTSFTQVNDFASRLKTNSAIQGVTLRAVDTAGAALEVQFAGSPTELAALLEGFGVKVASLTGSEITVQF